VSAIFLIIGVAFVLFFVLTMMMKRTDTPGIGVPREERKVQSCAICQDEFDEEDMIERKIGDGGYRRWFCDRCIIELYEESRMLHDPRTKASADRME